MSFSLKEAVLKEWNDFGSEINQEKRNTIEWIMGRERKERRLVLWG